jgi:hypothetical protein
MSGDRGTLGVEVARRAANLFSLKPRLAMTPEVTDEPARHPNAPDDGGVRAEPVLRLLERSFLYFDRLLGRALPEPLNPFLQTGAVAITSLAVATLTGIVLLIWYRPSLHLAYDSVAAMSQAPFTAGPSGSSGGRATGSSGMPAPSTSRPAPRVCSMSCRSSPIRWGDPS